MKKTIISFFFLIMAFNVCALRSSDHESFTDPDFDNYKPKSILVIVENASNTMRLEINKQIEKYFSKKGVKITDYRSLFPPTRQWSNDDLIKRIKVENIQSILVITPGASSKQVIPMFTNTFSNTNIQGNANLSNPNNVRFNGNARTNSTSYNTNLHKSKSEFSAVLLDANSGKTAWFADIIIKAGGSLFVGEKGDAKGVSKTIVKILGEDGHL